MPATRIPKAKRRTAAAALRPRKRPRQTRSSATVEAILEAAARVLAGESLAGFNTNRVAEVAGLSVGSLYQYFPNKASLAAGLIERHQATLAAAVEAAVEDLRGEPLERALTALAELAVRQQFAAPLLAAALDHEEQRLPLRGVIEAAQARIVRAVERLLADHRARLPPELPPDAARDCLILAKALVEAAAPSATDPAAPRVAVDTADLVRRIQRALLGYLTVSAAAR